jgi:hypothetical protein
MEENEMGKACSMLGGRRMHIRVLMGSWKEEHQ